MIGVGLIGTGFIGRTHAMAYRAAPAVFPDLPPVRLVAVADQNRDHAEAAARRFGFESATEDWTRLLADPAIDIVAIATPNHLHKDMALAALAAGKHVHCEKPLATAIDDAAAMAAAAASHPGQRTLVGYNYLCNPLIAEARRLIAAGRIGTPVHFRGTHVEDYMADPDVPFSWRCDRRLAGLGALGDVGSHIVAMADYLLGPVAEVSADAVTVVTERRQTDGTMRRVENDDQAQCLVRFHSGATGTLEASRVAVGRKMGLAFEITGRTGAIAFDQERMNEIRLYESGGDATTAGFKTILSGPEHPDFGHFVPAAGHGLGFNDLKVIEVCRMIRAVTRGTAVHPDFGPDFGDALRYERTVDAIARSATERRWIGVAT